MFTAVLYDLRCKISIWTASAVVGDAILSLRTLSGTYLISVNLDLSVKRSFQ